MSLSKENILLNVSENEKHGEKLISKLLMRKYTLKYSS